MEKRIDLNVIRISYEFYPGQGGSVTHIHELIKKINPYINQQIIFSPLRNEKSPSDLNKISIIRIPLVNLSFFSKIGLPTIPFILFIYALMVTIKIIFLNISYKNTILHVHGSLLGCYIVIFSKFLRLNYPIVIMQHGVTIERSVRSKIVNNLTIFLLKYFKPKHFIMLDDGTQIEKTIKKLNEYKIPSSIVYHGIDTDHYYSNDYIKHTNNFIILSNHRLIPVKRVDIIIQIFSLILKKIDSKSIFLYIAGDGECRQKLMKLVNKLGIKKNVFFLGRISEANMPLVIRKADLVIGTSLESNMNRSIQEAMSCSKTVIVFNNGGINKLIINQENGILIDIGDINKFVNEIIYLYSHRSILKNIGEKAKNTILKKRSWNTRINTELRIYNKVLSKVKS